MNPIASPAVARWPGQFVRVVSLVASVVASSVLLVGWTLDKAILKSVVPGLATMKANTALSFMLAGVALWLLRTERSGRISLIVGRISAGIAALIGLLSLSQYLFGLNLGIDELLVREVPEVAARTRYPGRMSFMTALNFTLLGPALFCLGIRRWSRGPLVAQLLGMGGAAIALLALIGYFFGTEALYQVGPYSSMALHTATLFLLLGCGIWLARPEYGIAAVVLTDTIGGLMVHRLWPASVGAILIFGFLQVTAVRVGMIPEVFGAALMVWGSILYVTGLIVWAAASLNRADESSKEQLRSFFEATAVGMAQSDPEGRLLRINNAYGRITGYSQEELSGRSLPDLTHPDEREADLARFRMMANGETPVYDVEKRCVRKDGAIIWCHATAAAVRDPGGRAVTIAVAMEDITERKSTEQALRQSEQRFAQFMQYLPGLAWIKDLQGRYMYANDAAEMAFHTSRAQLYGKTDDEIFPPEIASQFRENDRRALASGTGEQVIETLKHGNGVLHYSLVSKFTIPGPDGEAALVGGVAIDITELKRAEEALRESDRRKDQFLAMLAHELRNPLAALDSSLALLADTHFAGDRDWAMKISMRQVRHLARMVDDLLDASRITRGTIRLQTELVQPAEVIGRAIEAMRHLAEAKGHQLCVSMAPHLPKLEADPTRLEQIISNLLTNAIKFTQPGGRVEVSVQVEGSTLVLTVRDTGAGIAPEFLPHVFELFAQSDTSLSREHGGLGLGLTLVKALIEQHGGSVEARSEGLGRGSEFAVRLPTFNGDAVIVPENGSIKKPLDACRKSGPVRILMVEDNLEYARCLGRLLEATGYEIRISCDGPTALDEAHLWIPDVFLLDLGLPGMDGFEVARRIHEDASFARAKVVVVSGYAGEEEHRRSEEIGIDAHLAKPVVLRDLLRTISDEDRASLA